MREIVDWRLAEYFQRSAKVGSGWVLNVSHSNGNPILFLPSRDDNPNLPEGWTDVKIGDEESIEANFVKIAVNVARRSGSEENILPEVLVRWFGSDAGKPGTRHRVMLHRDGTEWRLSLSGASGPGSVPY